MPGAEDDEVAAARAGAEPVALVRRAHPEPGTRRQHPDPTLVVGLGQRVEVGGQAHVSVGRARRSRSCNDQMRGFFMRR